VTVAERFGQNLAHQRKLARISQEDLGLRANLHRTEISLLERGQRIPRIDTLVKLAASLDVKPDALLADISWKPGEFSPGRYEG